MQNNESAEMMNANNRSVILELTVNNHPGVMSHICMLFARRAFNVEKILCLPIENGKKSLIYLTINKQNIIDQVVKQLHKLEDVFEIRKNVKDIFEQVERIIR